MSRQSTQEFQDSGTLLFDTLRGTCHYPLVKIHRMCTTKCTPSCKLWTLSDIDVSVWTINWEKYTTVQDVISNQWGNQWDREHMRTLCFLLNIAINLKLLKIKSI